MLKIFLLFFSLFLNSTWASGIFNNEFQITKLEGPESVRYLINNILEIAANLPTGTIIQYPKDNINAFYDYRDLSGNIQRSSTGFFSKVMIVSVSAENEGLFPPERIAKLNNMANGLFIIKSVQETNNQEFFQALSGAPLNADYLSFFTETGKAKYAYSTYFAKRFGNSLNHSIDVDKMNARDRLKWQAIYDELKLAGNREVKTSTDYLFMNLSLANQYTVEFEKTGATRSKGAWTMAVKSTAVRHNFSNVPCAEFMSEMIRQAYNRANYDFKEDFNDTFDNYLIWSKSAAVVNLANSLHKAGWIPWELNKYSPPTGAIMMHEEATSPGHTYMIAGDNGRFIVDNGSPAGRDLRKTSKKTIDMMFKGGVFFLPPGIIPSAWPFK